MSSSEVEVTPKPDGRKKWLSMQVKPVSARTDEYAESLEHMADQDCLIAGSRDLTYIVCCRGAHSSAEQNTRGVGATRVADNGGCLTLTTREDASL